MEKKHRDIVVDDQKYGWTMNDGGKEQYVQVWKDKKVVYRQTFRQTSVTPADIEELIRGGLKAEAEFRLLETLNKEWTAFLDTVPWSGYGSTIAESNIIFSGKRKYWMKKMVKKHNVEMNVLEDRYAHD